MADLSLKNINKIYPNNVQAVFNFDMDIKDKEFIVFVGPSGCGKSTTLRMVAGLETITSGELFIDGSLVNDVEPKDRNIAMVFQSYALYPHMTTYKNIEFALKLRKVPKPIYAENEEVKKYEEQIKEIYKRIKTNDRLFRKDQNNDTYVDAHLKLYAELYKVYDEMISIQTPIKGIDNYGINVLEKRIKKLEKELKKNKKTLEEAKICLEDLEKKPIPTNEKKAKSLKNDLLIMNNAVKIYTSAINQNVKQIESSKERVEYLKHNEVNLYKVMHLDKVEKDIEVNKAAECLGLTKYLFRKPGALSGGQRQRVALGRCIVRKPKVFLMDEPLSNLDAKLRVQTRGEILDIHKRVGATTIYVTHDQTEAMTMADRIVVMKSGIVQQIGTPVEVYNNPSNKFVASFIGSPSMNFLIGKYKNGKVVINESNEFSFDVKEYKKILKDYEDKEIYLGFRPENITTVANKGKGNIECRVKSFEILGFNAVIYAEAFNQKILITAKAEDNIKPNDQVYININAKKLYFFDKENGNRIK